MDFQNIQKIFISSFAVSTVSVGMYLIGGLKFYLLNNSPRLSNDIDFHYEKDLAIKKNELKAFILNSFLPMMKRDHNITGHILPNHPEEESINLKVIHIFLTQEDKTSFDLPIEITKIICFDKKNIETFNGKIIGVVSNADLIESKVIAFFSRYYFQARDLVDIWLFKNMFLKDSGKRIFKKLNLLSIDNKTIKNKITDLKNNKTYHTKQIKEVFLTQTSEQINSQIENAGGFNVVLDQIINILDILKII